MKPGIVGALLVGMLAAPMAASAALVTWEIGGSIRLAGGQLPPVYADIVAGERFQLLLSFDTDATLLETREGGDFEPGRRYEYDPSSMSASLVIGGRDPLFIAVDPLDTRNSLLWARDDAGDVPVDGQPVDGYTFNLDAVNDAVNASLQIVMRGPVLDIVTGPALPAVPDPRLADLAISNFGWLFRNAAGVGIGGIVGDFDSIRSAQVPEPGSLALLGLGLLGLGAARLRGESRRAA